MLSNSHLKFIYEFSESDNDKIFFEKRKKKPKRKYINQRLKEYGFKHLKLRKRLISI